MKTILQFPLTTWISFHGSHLFTNTHLTEMDKIGVTPALASVPIDRGAI